MNIPVGTSDFSEIRREHYYFVDKTGLIKNMLRSKGTKVTLITRPRRFGKTLCMSMLAEFFDIRKRSSELFDGLSVMEEKEICGQWMNQYPVLFLSFKSVDGLDFANAYAQLVSVIAELYKSHSYLIESDQIHPLDQKLFYRISAEEADLKDIKNSIQKLTQLLRLYYGKPVILLIDEYDVPLAKASEKGYYPEMLDAVKGIMQAVKDNDSLKFAVVTGCLRIAKESIFTGTNNFVSDTISDSRLNEFFGFTQAEVDRLLADTGLTACGPQMKEWYNGYHFGDFDVNDKFETLLAGGYIREPLEENLTYDMLEGSEENLWSLLYFAGYLTRVRPEELPDPPQLPPGRYALKIPNTEVMGIFKKSVKIWFAEAVAEKDRKELFGALWSGDEDKLTGFISDLLFETISYNDYAESFYHAFLTGLFSNAGYRVESNYENGLGRSDVVVKDRKQRRAVVVEAKRADSERMLEKGCEEALAQIEEKQYAKKVELDGFNKVVRLGIAFFRKECLVRRG